MNNELLKISPAMSKQTIQSAVWQAADQLFTQGIRPTVVSVREITKRGSAGTINASLKDWWAHLSQQIVASDKRPDVPEPIVESLRQLWAAALEQADIALLSHRQEFDRLVKEAQTKQAEAVAAQEAAQQQCVEFVAKIQELTSEYTKVQSDFAAEAALRRQSESRIQAVKDEAKIIADDMHASVSRMEKQMLIEDERYKSMERNLVAQADENKVLRKQLEKRLLELQSDWQKKESAYRAENIGHKELLSTQSERSRQLEQRILILNEEILLSKQQAQSLLSQNAALDARLATAKRSIRTAPRSAPIRTKIRRP